MAVYRRPVLSSRGCQDETDHTKYVSCDQCTECTALTRIAVLGVCCISSTSPLCFWRVAYHSSPVCLGVLGVGFAVIVAFDGRKSQLLVLRTERPVLRGEKK